MNEKRKQSVAYDFLAGRSKTLVTCSGGPARGDSFFGSAREVLTLALVAAMLVGLALAAKPAQAQGNFVTVSAGNPTVTIGKGETATNTGSYVSLVGPLTLKSECRVLSNVWVPCGTVEKHGDDSGTWSWSFDTTGATAKSLEVRVVGRSSLGFSGQANFMLHITDTYEVTSTNDSGVGSLRQAIEHANAESGAQTIAFDIPGGGVKTIAPASSLPEITDPVTIDGYTQPGASPNTLADGNDATLKIELNGVNAGTQATGLIVGTTDSTVRGLAINRFGSYAIFVPAQKGFRNNIQGNFLGTDATGAQALGNNLAGIFIAGGDTALGGAEPAARNVISGNRNGILLGGTANSVKGNYIGTKADGAGPLANSEDGVRASQGFGSSNTIGGVLAGEGNVIAYNGDRGITSLSATRKGIIRSNAIHSNGALGLDLGDDGVTENDPKDEDSGPNGLQNFPELSSAVSSGGATTIKGSLNSTPHTMFHLDFFSSPEKDPSGHGEGKKFLTRTSVSTDANGYASIPMITADAAPGEFVTATADGPDGTSEFSEAVAVTVPDTTPPDAPVIESPADNSYDTDGDVTLSGTAEAGSIVELFDGTAPQGSATANANGKWSKTVAGVPEGSHPYTAKATDAAGNVSSASGTTTVTVDKSAPTTTIDSGPSGATDSRSAAFTFSSDEPGSTFECSLDGAVWSACSSPKNHSNLTAGTHAFEVRAIDKAGNTGPAATRAWTVSVDEGAPTVESVTPANGAKKVPRSTNVTVTFSEAMKEDTLNETTVKLVKKGKGKKKPATPVSASVSPGEDGKSVVLDPGVDLAKGAYTATVTSGAKDEAGNALASKKTWSFKVK